MSTRRIPLIIQLVFAFVLIYCQQSLAQTVLLDEFARLSFKAVPNKVIYFPLEPVFLHLELSNQTGESLGIVSSPSFKRINLNVEHKGKFSTFNDLFLIGAARNGLVTDFGTDRVLADDIILEKDLDKIFPEIGRYKVQVVLGNGRAENDVLYRTVKSEVVEIDIAQPSGINKQAVEFLRKNQDRVLFYWKDAGKADQLLQTFAQKYSESVFGEYAILQLGLAYKNGNEYEKAKAEFEKIKESSNQVISLQSKQQLAELK